MEDGYQTLLNNLAQDLLAKVKNTSPTFFERLVIDLLLKMGYGGSLKDAGKAIGQTGDEGIDGIINEDKLGLDVIYIQAKRWKGTVGNRLIHQFVGALEGKHADKGIFITTSNFTKNAKEYASKIDKKVVLIDGQQLVQHMIDYDIGVSKITNYEVKKIDTDYFNEE